MERRRPGPTTLFGWPGPYPEPVPLAARHAEAEQLTDRLSARDLAVLEPAERDELAAVLGAIARAAPSR